MIFPNPNSNPYPYPYPNPDPDPDPGPDPDPEEDPWAPLDLNAALDLGVPSRLTYCIPSYFVFHPDFNC